jgi:hypothetical protein
MTMTLTAMVLGIAVILLIRRGLEVAARRLRALMRTG